ncbi:MAG: hypothetical protein M0024_03625 [Nitrospiraceae bacterium]|nr:hypothetical protein [Nitrospiraceae bacterium]
MGGTPNFKMQCPKCGKDFPFDATHCEECSAMLEPVELSGTPSEDPSGEAAAAGPIQKAGAPSPVSDETIEDIRIDSLKADIENRFLFALLLELDQLKKRLSKKEELLSGLQEKQDSLAHVDFVSRTGRAESESEEILTRITKIELVLDTLEKKISSDIAGLQKTHKGLEQPALFRRFSPSGRYYRLIDSELKIKTVLLRIIKGELPRTYFRQKRLARMAALGSVGVCAALFLSWLVVSQGRDPETAPAHITVATETGQGGHPVNRQDVLLLLEDIRTANLTKNLKLWESRYSKSYLEKKGRAGSISEQWKQFDYKSLRYELADVHIAGTGADAVIIWDIELKPVKGGPVSRVRSRLASTFILEDGTLKISSVRKEDR